MPTNLRHGLVFAAQLAAIVAVSWAGLAALRALLLEDPHPIGMSQLIAASGGTLCIVGAAILIPVRGTPDTRLLMQATLICGGLVFWSQALAWLDASNLDREDLRAVEVGLIALMLCFGLTSVLGDRLKLTRLRMALLFLALAAVAALAWYLIRA